MKKGLRGVNPASKAKSLWLVGSRHLGLPQTMRRQRVWMAA
jgi:hypothetical protein